VTFVADEVLLCFDNFDVVEKSSNAAAYSSALFCLVWSGEPVQ